MITMIIKLNRKRIAEQPMKPDYENYKKTMELFLNDYGFTPKGKGVYVSHKEVRSTIKDVIFPLMNAFVWTFEDMMDDIAEWSFVDDRMIECDVLYMYNKYGREHFEKEVIPEIRAYKRTRGVELRARLIKERKEREKANPPKPTEESDDDDEEVF